MPDNAKIKDVCQMNGPRKAMYRVSSKLMGGKCICRTLGEVADMLQDADDPDDLVIKEIQMSDAEFEALPEFQGF